MSELDSAPVDVNNEVAPQETTTAEPSAAETKTPEVADPILAALGDEDASVVAEPEVKDETKEETESEAAPEKEAAPTDETETEEKPRGKVDAETRIRQLNAEKRELEQRLSEYSQTIEQLNTQVYKPQSEAELVEEGMPEAEAKVEALKQQMEVEKFNTQVTQLNNNIESQAADVLRDFPMFDPSNDAFNQQEAERAAAQYLREAKAQIDPNTGLTIGINKLPYEFYKDYVETYERGQRAGQIKHQQSTDKMLASAAPPSSAAPKTAKVDPVLAALKSDD